jgi:NAD(P)-dependent dehydrogenase (short-subunit alcohol dehydrogenase family)
VTGGSPGIGLELARLLASDGHDCLRIGGEVSNSGAASPTPVAISTASGNSDGKSDFGFTSPLPCTAFRDLSGGG